MLKPTHWRITWSITWLLMPWRLTLPGHQQSWHWINRISETFAAAITGSDYFLTHWGRVTHICVSKLTIIGSDNGLSPGRHQATIWTNAGILLIAPLGTNFSENVVEIHIFSFRKMHLKMSSGKWRLFCLGVNVLMLRNEGTHSYST